MKSKGLFIGSVLVLAIGTWIFYINDQKDLEALANVDDNVKQAIAEFEALGYTLDADELGSRLSAKGSENAAEVFWAIGDRFSSDGDIGKIWSSGENVDSAFVTLHEEEPEIYELIEKSIFTAVCEFRRDWSMGPAMLLPEYSQAKTMVRYCAVLAEYDASNGDLKSATRKLIAAASIGQHIGREPIMIGKLVEYSIRSTVLNSAFRIVGSLPIDEYTARFVETISIAIGEAAHMSFSLQGVGLSGYLSIRDYSKGAINQLASGGSFIPKPERELDTHERKVAITLFLNRLVQLHSIWTQEETGAEIIRQTQDFQAEIDEDKHEGAEFVRILAPFYPNAYLSYSRSHSFYECMRALSNVLKDYLEFGSSITMHRNAGKHIDPLTGRPFELEIEEDSIKIYSVGQNEQNDGGPRKKGYSDPTREYDDFGFWIELKK